MSLVPTETGDDVDEDDLGECAICEEKIPIGRQRTCFACGVPVCGAHVASGDDELGYICKWCEEGAQDDDRDDE